MAPRMDIGVPIAGGVRGVPDAFPGQSNDTRLNGVMKTLGRSAHDLDISSPTPARTNQFDIRL